jgi:hypothetical protein
VKRFVNFNSEDLARAACMLSIACGYLSEFGIAAPIKRHLAAKVGTQIREIYMPG